MSKTNKAIGGGGFHHVAIRSANFDASVKFYEEVLGCVEKVRWDAGDTKAVMLDTGDGNYIEIFANGSKGPKPEGNIIHYALRTDDIDAAIERVRAAGATIIHNAKTVDFVNAAPNPTTVRVAFFSGPDGEIIELFQSDAL